MSSQPDNYGSVLETCKRFGFSRSTFYRMLADRDSGLAEIVVRVPPLTGRLRVPQRGFETWLKRQQKRRS